MSIYIINDANHYSKRNSKEIEIYYFSKALKSSGKERFLSKIQDLTFSKSSISQGLWMSNPEFCFGMTST
jgi:hypothetical protein